MRNVLELLVTLDNKSDDEKLSLIYDWVHDGDLDEEAFEQIINILLS